MNVDKMRQIDIAGAYNIRDLGGYPLPGGGETQWRRILRADSLHRLDADGIAALADEGVRLVIDLRHAGELDEAPNPFCGHPELGYRNISLFEDLAPGPDMAERHGGNLLLGLYIVALTQRGTAIREVLSAIADAPPGAVIFHCTAGKDRTGLIAALVLLAAGVPDNVIVADYAMTGSLIAPLIEGLIAGAAARGGDVEGFKRLLAAEPATMASTLAYLNTTHAGIDGYFDEIGFGAAKRQALVDRLTGIEMMNEDVA